MIEVIPEVYLEYDHKTEMWASFYEGFESRVSSCGDDREEALAMLVEATALYAEELL